jgi:superfamily II DNA or RNA helicase
LVSEFNAAGIPAEHVDGYMNPEDREDILKAHDNGEFLILSCSKLLNTGWDSPKTSCLIDAFPTRSYITYVQRIGRIMRTAEGKENAIVLDHAGNVERFGFAEDIVPEYLDNDDGDYNEKKTTNQEEKPEPKVKECPQCYRQFIGIRCSCGYEIPISVQIETTQEELVKLEKAEAKMATKEEKISFYAQLKNYAHQKNYNPSWADHKYREKYGTWFGYGNKHDLPFETITPAVSDWILSKQIAWAKKKEKAA